MVLIALISSATYYRPTTEEPLIFLGVFCACFGFFAVKINDLRKGRRVGVKIRKQMQQQAAPFSFDTGLFQEYKSLVIKQA